MDKTFTLNSPVNFSSADADSLTLTAAKFDEHLKFNFDIGKKLFYLDDAQTEPTSGSNNEFVLIHAWYPTLRNQNIEDFDMTPILVGGKAVSTFKDI